MLEDMQYTYFGNILEYFDAIFVYVGGSEFGNGLLGYDTYEEDYFGIEY